MFSLCILEDSTVEWNLYIVSPFQVMWLDGNI